MIKKSLTLASVALLSFSVQTAKFTEGDYYKVLDLPRPNSPVVTEFFSFYSPHCNTLEPMIQKMKKQLPNNAKLQKKHVSFMGGSMGIFMAKAFASSIILGVDSKITPVLFNRIHGMKKPPRDEAELRQILIDEGIKAEDYDAIFNNFAVNSMVNRFNKAFQDSGLTGVPAVVVNNKYLLQTNKIKSADEYFELVNFLLKK